MQHPFISGNLDSKPIKDLLLEYKADVVEEELVDEEAEVIDIQCCEQHATKKYMLTMIIINT